MADTDIAKLTFQVDNSEGIRRIQEIDKSLKAAGKATTDFTQKIQALGKSLAAFKIFDTIAKGSNDLQQSARRLAVAISTSASEANNFTYSIKNWIYGVGQLNPALNSTAKTLRQLTSEFTMTRSQAAEAIGDIAARLNTSFDNTNLQKALSFLPQATQNWAAYLGRLNEAQQIQDAFIRALATGMTRGLTRFGIQIDTQSESFKVLAENIRRSTGYSEEYSKRLAVMQKLMEQTSKAEGAFTEQSDSLANQWESLKNNLKEIKDMVADMLGKSIEPIVRAINNVLTPFTKSMLASLATSVGRILFVKITFTSIGNLIKIATNNIVKFANEINNAKNNANFFEQKLGETLDLTKQLNFYYQQMKLAQYVKDEKQKAKIIAEANAYYAKVADTTKNTLDDVKKLADETAFKKFEIKVNRIKNNLNTFTTATLAVSTALSLIPTKADSAGEKIKEFAGKIMTAVYALNLFVSAIPASLAQKVVKAFSGTVGTILLLISKIALGVVSAGIVVEQHIHDLMKLLNKFEPIKKMLESQGWLMKWISGMSISEKIAEKIRGIWSNTAEEVAKENEKAKDEAEKIAEHQKEALTNQINALTEKAKTFFNSINDELQQLLSAANETRSTATTAIYAQSVEALQYRTMKTDQLAMKVYREVGDRALQKSNEISAKLDPLRRALENIEKNTKKEYEFNEYSFQQ